MKYTLKALILCLFLYGANSDAQNSDNDQKPEQTKEETASQIEYIKRLEEKIEILATEINQIKVGQNVFGEVGDSKYGLAPAASKVYSKDQGISLGGYGEFVYKKFANNDESNQPSGRDDISDFLRLITYIGYKFNDNWVFNSEIEYEHASTSQSGSVSVEFAQLDYLHKPYLNFRIGTLLAPMGYINQLHEPPVFLAASRPLTETNIIPSTWRENGLGIFGEINKRFRYNVYLMNSFDGTGRNSGGFSSSGFRGARQKGSKALSNDFAVISRVDYIGMPGVNVGVSAFVGQTAQNTDDPLSSGEIKALAQIYEAHADYQKHGVWLRALAAYSYLNDVDSINTVLGNAGTGVAGEMLGVYAEAAYNVLYQTKSEHALYPYFRYEHIDTQKDVQTGFSKDLAKIRDVYTIGLHYRPISKIVFKTDYEIHKTDANTGVNQYNLAFGYMF